MAQDSADSLNKRSKTVLLFEMRDFGRQNLFVWAKRDPDNERITHYAKIEWVPIAEHEWLDPHLDHPGLICLNVTEMQEFAKELKTRFEYWLK